MVFASHVLHIGGSHCLKKVKGKSKADDANNRCFFTLAPLLVYSVADFLGSHVNVFGHLVTEARRNASSDATVSKNLQI